MDWILAVLTTLLVAALARFFVINARTLMRDMKKTYDPFQARLEREANSVLDAFFSIHHADSGRPDPQASTHSRRSGPDQV